MSVPDVVSDLINSSRAQELAGDIGKAYQFAREAVEKARTCEQAEALAVALLCLAGVHFRMGHIWEAIDLAKKALSLTGTDDTARVDALLMLGMCGGGEDYITEREEYYLRAVDLSRQLGYHRALLRGLHNLASGVYMIRGQFELALAADQEALHLASERSMPELAWGPLTTISWIFWMTGRYDQAQSVLNDLALATQPGSLGKGYYYCTSANLAIERGLNDQALPLYARARSIAEAMGVPDLSVYVRLGLSCYHRLNGDQAVAYHWANDAVSIAQKAEYRYLEGIALIERGRSVWTSEPFKLDLSSGGFPNSIIDKTTVEKDFRAAIKVLTGLSSNYELARVNLYLAAWLHQQKQNGAEDTWLEATRLMLAGGYDFLTVKERSLVYPLVADYLNSRSNLLADANKVLLDHLQRQPAVPLKVVTLGGLQVWIGERYIDKPALRQRRAGELMALLLFSPRHTLLIEQAIEALIPEEEAITARGIFHHATSCLRRALEPDLPAKLPSRYLLVEDNQVSLVLPERSWVDYEVFEQACQNHEWEAALALYGGELLPEYLYADWSTAMRQQISQYIQQALLGAAEERQGKKNFTSALEACRKLLEIEPWQERAVSIAMHACLELGDSTGALRFYRNLEKSLRTELGVEPEVELQNLAREITHKK